MLNKVILMGRITRDLEIRQTPNGTSVLTFGIAVERSYARQGEERQTDFISCVAWRNTAEFIYRYFGKGRMIAIVGNLRTRTYNDKNGTKHYITEVFVDEVSFTGEPKPQNGYAQNSYQSNGGYGQNSYQQQGGYQGGYQQNNNPNSNGNVQQPTAPNADNPPAPNAPDDPLDIGDMQDFEAFAGDGVPF